MSYLNLSGTSGDYASTPDSAALSITGDIDIRCKVALTDWTPAATNRLLAKRSGAGTSYDFYLEPSGGLAFYDGATQAISTAPVGFADGATRWVRVTRTTTGSVRFYTSADGVAWTQLGSVLAVAAGNLADTAVQVTLGMWGDGNTSPLNGKIYAAEIRNGIDGTLVANPRFDQQTAGTTSFADVYGNVWTLNGTAAIEGEDPPTASISGGRSGGAGVSIGFGFGLGKAR